MGLPEQEEQTIDPVESSVPEEPQEPIEHGEEVEQVDGDIESEEPVTISIVDRKGARKVPSIMTDFVFTKKALLGEEVDPMLAMLKPEIGKFSIMHAIMAWSKIIGRFSDTVIVGTARLLHKSGMLESLNAQVNEKIDETFKKINY